MNLKKYIFFSKIATSKNLNLICFFLFVFGLFYIATYTYENIYLDFSTEFEIRKALDWLNGKFYWPGPEITYGHYPLPGPFAYFLLFPPLLFGGNIYSKLLVWRIIWLALSYTVAFHFTNKICKHKESLFIFIMFLVACIGTSLFTPIFFPFKSAFTIMFHILAVIALYTWKETGQNKYLYFSGLIIGFGVQVHPLILTHIVTAIILFVIPGKKKKSWKSFLWFIIFIFLPCLTSLSFYDLYVFEFQNSLIRLKQLNSFKYILFPSEFWFSSFHTIISFKPYLAGPVFLLALLVLYKTRLKKTFPLSPSSINLFIVMAPSSCLLSIIGGHWWYIYSIPVMSMVLVTKLYDDLMPAKPDKKLNCLILCGILFILPLAGNIQDIWAVKFYPEHYLVTGLFLALIYLLITTSKINYIYIKIPVLLVISFFHLFSKDYERNISYYFSSYSNNTVKNWINSYVNSKYHFVKPFLQQIALDTNWEPDTAIKRMYIIGTINRQISVKAHYSLIKEQVRNIKSTDNLNLQIQGYFIIEHLKQFINDIKKDWKEDLSRSPYVSPFVQQEIKTGKLLLQDPKLYGRYWLIPYKLTEYSVLQEGFYNIGQSYYWEEPHWLKNCPSTKSFTRNHYEFYYCMILPGHLQRAGVHITFPKKTHTSFTEVSFFGPMLGLKTETILADGYAYWSDIHIALFCNNQKFIYPMPNIGYNPKSWVDFISLSGSLNSPLRLKIPIVCKKEEISQIKLRFKHKKRHRFDYSEMSPEQKDITWDIPYKF